MPGAFKAQENVAVIIVPVHERDVAAGRDRAAVHEEVQRDSQITERQHAIDCQDRARRHIRHVARAHRPETDVIKRLAAGDALSRSSALKRHRASGRINRSRLVGPVVVRHDLVGETKGARRFSDADLRKLAGENFIRVFTQAEAVAARTQKERKPSAVTIAELDGKVHP